MSVGRAGEELAAAYLVCQGYKICERNLFFRTGEIDILAEKGGCLVIVEVKTVSGKDFGPAKGYVNQRKQEKLKHLSGYLIQKFPNKRIRIDVIGVDLSTDKPVFEHIENAVF